ncbi:MAG: peptidase S45 [Chloroflexi bacterium RBG_19FT_COMBO_50_10]|nr:MAG: peptidase S45 [Chloroflexi bacterium RBG_19FT_COMBO_50_10]
MLSKLGRLLFSIISVIVVLAIVLGVVGVYLARSSFPQTSGEVKLNGLESPVDIFRDSYGIPHIYAQTSHDLFFAQGYVQAQDRFWQMDFWRHIGSGRLSEMFGESQLDTDTFLRTLGWARVVQQELEALSANERAVLQAYADGVNAYLADHKGAALSLEYAVLKLLTPGYSPEPWQPLSSLTWGKAMAWNLGESRLDAEVGHAILMKILTPEQIGDIYPPYPSDHPVVVPGYSTGTALNSSTVQSQGIQILAEMYPAFESILASMSNMESVLGPSGSGIGSNNWVIAGSRTSTGEPFLANDMHLGEQMPSIWYEIGLHCVLKGPECPYEVTGYSFPSMPGVIVGHTDRIAWGFTNVGPDVLDLYIEKINPDNPNQYEVNGQWMDMTMVQETIQVAGSDPVELTVRYTRHGPVIWDNPDENIIVQEKWGVELPANYAISVRWTALEPVNIVKAVLGFDSAQNWNEYRQAAMDFTVPSQNMVFADIDGNIAYQTPGNIPIRLPGHSGDYPVPGWTDEYEWQGYIPFEQLPNAFNPPEGFIVSANNAIVGSDYAYKLSTEDYGFRAARIVQMIETAPGPIDAAYIQKMHGDGFNASAAYLVPLLMQLSLQDQHLIEVRDTLTGWDYQNQMDLAAPALYNAYWRAVLAGTFQDELPEDYWPDGGDAWFEIMHQLIQTPDSAWWDDTNTTAVETREDILRSAFSNAVAELEQLLGKDSGRWTWGDLHTVTFYNQSLGTSGIAPIEAIFNRGPYRAAGGGSIVNATSWMAYETDPVKAYQVSWLPSERMIVDLSNLPVSLSVNTTGESGHAFHRNYNDQVDLWRMVQYHPMLWDQQQVESAAKDHLVLSP